MKPDNRFTPEMRPETHHIRALVWLQEAGFDPCTVQTFVADFHAPLGKEVKEALAALIEMRRGAAEAELPPGDWDLFQRLTRSESCDYILNIPEIIMLLLPLLYSRAGLPDDFSLNLIRDRNTVIKIWPISAIRKRIIDVSV